MCLRASGIFLGRYKRAATTVASAVGISSAPAICTRKKLAVLPSRSMQRSMRKWRSCTYSALDSPSAFGRANSSLAHVGQRSVPLFVPHMHDNVRGCVLGQLGPTSSTTMSHTLCTPVPNRPLPCSTSCASNTLCTPGYFTHCTLHTVHAAHSHCTLRYFHIAESAHCKQRRGHLAHAAHCNHRT